MLNKLFLFVLFVMVLTSCDVMHAGSYGYAEIFPVNEPEEAVVEKMLLLKQRDNLEPPSKYHLFDGRSDSLDYWFHIFLCDNKKRKLYSTWVRGDIGNKKSKIALVAVRSDTPGQKWKLVNRDLSRSENKEAKAFFESMIIEKLKQLSRRTVIR